MTAGPMAPGLPPPTHLLYLHGFRSSPQSAKARQVAAWMARHQPQVAWHCPQLPPSPAQALREVEAHLEAWQRQAGSQPGHPPWADRLAVIGSSLGGFYATHLSARIGCRAVLLNPAVDPARDLAAYIGEQRAWHGDDRFFFEPRFIDELRALQPPDSLPHADRRLAVLGTDDEVLSFEEMRARHADGHLRIVPGGDHALSGFEALLPEVMAWLGW